MTSKIVNYYSVIPKMFLNDDYNNPNASKGAPLHPMRAILCGGSGSGKTNFALHLIKYCGNFERIYIYASKLDQPLYKYLIHEMEKVGKRLGVTLITYSSDIKDIPKSTDFDPTLQNLVIIDDMIMEKKLTSVENLFVKGRHNSVSVLFLSQSFHAIPKMIRLNCNYVFLRKVESVKDMKLILSNYSLSGTIDDLYKIYKYATEDPMSMLMIDLQTTNDKSKYNKNFEPISLESIVEEPTTKSMFVQQKRKYYKSVMGITKKRTL